MPRRRPCRPRTSASQPPRRLRTDYSESDTVDRIRFYRLVNDDLNELTRRNRQQTHKGDTLAVAMHLFRIGVGVMAVITAGAVALVVYTHRPWWNLVALQSIGVAYVGVWLVTADLGVAERVTLRREADRRRIPYSRSTPLYALLNRVNAHHNATYGL